MCPLAASRLVGAGAMVCHVLLVETERDGLLLVDTGFGSRDCATPRRVPAVFRALVRPRLDPAQTAAAQVRALGYRLDDVRHVVITHLDLDHAGGLHDFPAAAVHLHHPEHQGGTSPRTLAERTRYLSRQWAHRPRWQTYMPDGEPWMGLPAVRQLEGVRDEVAIVPLIGHTRGHSGVAVKTADRWILHAGDAIFHRNEVYGGPVPPGLRAFATMDEHDRRARLASVAAIRELARRPDITVTCSHDPEMLSNLRRS
jgi:glyoxylase-like metal-dependent hydrolase (beta-lactamase superfamily II)